MSSQTARRFHFIKEIASGGFGTVYLAKVMHADGFSRLAAVKMLQAQWTDSEEVARRIRDEARLLGLLRHRNIVDVIDLTSIDGRTAVIMEYLEGVDLRFVIEEFLAAAERMPVRTALEICAACASALDAAYNRPPIPGDKPLRVIHRDIKPSNVMVDPQGSIKVLDFGVARSEIENRESHTQELQFGSVDYMAPERLFFEPETPASDIYSLGATLYEILALEKLGKARGRPEKHGAHLIDRLSYLRSLVGLSGTLGGELESLIRAMLDFEHERRPSASEVYQRSRALARMVDDEDVGSWCERALPPLVSKLQARPRPPSKLSDSVLMEDSLAFAVGDDSDLREIPGVVQDPSEPGSDTPVGEELRRGALAELQGQDIIAPSPATGAPSATGEYAAMDDPEAWEDAPTKVGQEEELLGAAVNVGAPPMGRSLGDPADPFRGSGRDPSLDETEVATQDALMRVLSPSASGDAGRSADPDEDHTQLMRGRREKVPPPRPSTPVDYGGPPPPPKRGRMGIMLSVVTLGGCLVVCLLGLAAGALLALDVGGMRTALVDAMNEEGSQPTVVTEAPAEEGAGADEGEGAEPDASGAAPAVEEAAPTGPELVFQTDVADLKKLRVTCDGEKVSGASPLSLPMEAADECVVTAILADRSRLNAMVKGATAGTYSCFDAGETACKR